MSKQPHFYKAFSRLGITNKPIRQKVKNIGVEDAPNFILTKVFLNSFKNFKLDEFKFPAPEDIDPKDYLKVLFLNSLLLKEKITKTLKKGEIQIVIGGDNSITFSSLLALEEKVDFKKLGIIHFDSHADINSFAASPSKNFHGMYLRPFFDNFDIPFINELVPQKLSPAQILFIGDLNLDGDEPEFFKLKPLKNMTRTNFLKSPPKALQEIKNFSQNFSHLHINFDIDIFDKSVAGATGVPQDGRWFEDEIISILKILSKHPSLSLDLSEVNPKKRGAKKTIKLSQKIISQICEYPGK